MTDPYTQKIFLGLIHVHVLHHAHQEPFYGLWMIEELKSHGYTLGPGTLYPLLHRMEADALLVVIRRVVKGKVRKYYQITPRGLDVLTASRIKIREVYREIVEEDNHE